jgi:hypothetical protein
MRQRAAREGQRANGKSLPPISSRDERVHGGACVAQVRPRAVRCLGPGRGGNNPLAACCRRRWRRGAGHRGGAGEEAIAEEHVVWMTTRQLMPGTLADFERAWRPDTHPEGMLRAYASSPTDGRKSSGLVLGLAGAVRGVAVLGGGGPPAGGDGWLRHAGAEAVLLRPRVARGRIAGYRHRCLRTLAGQPPVLGCPARRRCALLPQVARAARGGQGRCGGLEVEGGGHGRGGCCLGEPGQAEQLLGGG